jgi:hypothetical protein
MASVYRKARMGNSGVVVRSNVDKLCAIKRGQLFWVGEVEEEGWRFGMGWG